MKEQDKIFKKVAEEHEEHIDFGKLWDQLEPHVPVKDKKRPVVLWFLFIGVFMASASFFMLSNVDRNPQAPEVFNNNQESEVQSKKIDISNETITAHTDIQSDNSIHPTPTTLINKHQAYAEIASPRASNLVSIIDPQTKIQDNTSNLPNQENLNSAISKNIDIPLAANDLNVEEHKNFAAVETLSDNPDLGVNSNQNTTLESGLLTMNFQLLKSEDVAQLPIVPIKKSLNWNLLFYAGVGFFDLQNAAMAGGLDISGNSNSKEKPLDYITAGISSDIKLSQKWYFQPGIRYARYSTRLSNNHTTYTPIISQGISEINIDESGFVSNINGDVNGIRTTNVQSKWHTYHHRIELPLNVRYIVYHNSRHRFSLDFGPVIRFWSGSDGAFIDHQDKLVKFTLDSNPYSVDRIGLNAGLSWEYRINPADAIQTSIMYDKHAHQRIEDDILYRQIFSSYRVNIGYKKYF